MMTICDDNDVYSRLEQLLHSQHSRHLTLPIFIQSEHSIPPSSNYFLINCGNLVTNDHVWGRLGEALFGISEEHVLTQSTFLEWCRKRKPMLREHCTVVLSQAECLLQEDPMILWTLLHIREILGMDLGLSLTVVVISQWNLTEFIRVFDGITPLMIKSDCSKKKSMEECLGTMARESCPEKMTMEEYHGIVQNIYNITRDQISNVNQLQAYVIKILPVLQQISNQCHIPFSDTSRLFQASLKSISILINGEALRSLYTHVGKFLRPIDKYLLLAAFLAATNPPKFDLKLFGNAGKKARVKQQQRKQKHLQMTLGLSNTPKAFQLDRLLAIFYFIVSNPIPSLITIQGSIVQLVERRLLSRISVLNKLDIIKYRCLISIDFASLLSRDLSFDLSKYLASSYQ